MISNRCPAIARIHNNKTATATHIHIHTRLAASMLSQTALIDIFPTLINTHSVRARSAFVAADFKQTHPDLSH